MLLTIGMCQLAGAQVAKPTASTERLVDSVSINFHNAKWNIDSRLGNNGATLNAINDRLTKVFGDSIYILREVKVIGGASPEGTVRLNRTLSENRAQALFNYFSRYDDNLNRVNKTFTYLGRDWAGVLRYAKEDPQLPYRDETLAVLQQIVDEKSQLAPGEELANDVVRMKRLRGGVPYYYMLYATFPKVRASRVVLEYERVLSPDYVAPQPEQPAPVEAPVVVPPCIPDTVYIEVERVERDTVYVSTCPERNFYMDLQTNMLFDALALPNIGVEFYVGKNFSVGANWLYGWWKSDNSHNYWRAYGGDIYGRWWFGRASHVKPLQGHHIGVYAQIFTYDFEFGGKGQMGGKPGGDLWDRLNYGAGVEYGYSLPVGRRLNIDFSIALGYATGTYHEYHPEDNCYVWDSTKKRNWFGPTKVGISLVWLIGHGNYNEKKGGKK